MKHNPPEGIWQPRPIPGFPECLHEVLDRIGIPWHFVSEETPIMRRLRRWAVEMFESGSPLKTKYIRMASGDDWRVVSAAAYHLGQQLLRSSPKSPSIGERLFAGTPFGVSDLSGNTSMSRVGQWVLLEVTFDDQGRGERGCTAIGVAKFPKSASMNPASAWASLSPWPTWWRANSRLDETVWDGRRLRIFHRSYCRVVAHEVAHWLLADEARRRDPEFKAISYNPPLRGLKSIREEVAATILELAVAGAVGCEPSSSSMEGPFAVSQVANYAFELKHPYPSALEEEEELAWARQPGLDRVAFGVLEASARWLRGREREFPVWLYRRIPAEAKRLAADFDCGLPTRADLKLFGLSREYEKIGGRVR